VAQKTMISTDIPGQIELKQVIIKLVVENRLPHAMLIHGNEGGCSLPLALFLVRSLMCEQLEYDEPCGHCGECVKTASMTHPDVHFIFPVNLNKIVKKTDDRHSASFMSDWRSSVISNPYMSLLDWYSAIDIENKQGFIGDEEITSMRKLIALRAFEGGARVFLIWHADKMNASFANKILKNLEEPSPNTFFILLSESPAKMLSTILSRVQVFREEHVSEEEMAEFLQKKFELSPQRARDVAFRAEGNLNLAIQESTNQNSPWLMEFRSWMRLAFARDIIGMYKWSEGMAKNTRDAQRQFCVAALAVLDRCYRIGWLHLDVPMEGEEAAFFKSFHPFINSANISGFVELIEQISAHIERNVNEKIVWFDSSIQAVSLIHEGKRAAAEQ
jgi:DNA polymerase-3 subunit delta'